MNARLLPLFGLVVCLSLLFTPLGAAQPQEPEPTSLALSPSRRLSTSAVADMTAASDLDYPGLSFRYVDTLGVAERAYFADTQYLNGADAMAVDGAGHLYVVENSGARLLKYQISDGANVWTIGEAGFHTPGEYTFDSPTDVELDSAGTIWVSDRHSLAQYDSSGTLLQEFPADAWNSGNDHTHFDHPRGITFDSAGRMYVSDYNNHRVQVYTFTVSGDPVYSTTIGVTGVSGADDAHFDGPAQLVTDSSDRLYVADSANNRVQRCEYSGGWTCATFDDDGLSFPFGLGIDDSDDTLYISDNNNGRVKVCDTTGTCQEFTNVPNRPTDIVIDSSGGIYISDYNDCVVEEYNDSGGVVRTVVGVEGVPYTTDDSHLNGPYGIDVDADGNVYVGTEAGYRLVKMGSWSAGTPGVYGNTNQTFGSWWAGVRGVAVAPDGTIYAVDTANQRIQVFDADGTYRTTLGETGVSGTDDDHFAAPEGVAVDDAGNVYVADSRNHRVQIYDSDLVYLGTLGMGSPGSDNRRFDNPDNVTVDGDGNVYVADEGNDRVQVFDSTGAYSQTIGSGKLSGPQDVAVDAQGRVYVADIYNNRVQVFAADGDYLTTIGGVWGRGPGAFRHAAGVAVGDDGRVYITDQKNHRVQVLEPHVPGWRQANVNGFGNSRNWGAWALGVFSDTLYASTSQFGTGGEVYRLSGDAWEQVVNGGFDDSDNIAVNKFTAFDGQLYAGTWAEMDGGEIWRSSNGDSGSWEQVVDHGFGDPVNIEIIALKPFDGQLYAGTYCEGDADSGSEIWRSPSGDTGSWTQVVSDTVFGESNHRAIPSLEVFSDTLYAATANDDTGGEVWRSSDGTTWNPVAEDGFGNAKNTEVVALEVFDGQLYAGVRNYDQGGEIWRTSNGTAWEQVASGGLGDGDNSTFSSLVVVHGALYAIADNNETGVDVFRSSTGDGGSWQQVADTGFGTGVVSQADWEGAATAWDGTLFIGTYTTYGSGGGRVWEMLRQIYLPLMMRS